MMMKEQLMEGKQEQGEAVDLRVKKKPHTVVKMEKPTIKEESDEDLTMELRSWDGTSLIEPRIDITIEDHNVQLQDEYTDNSLQNMLLVVPPGELQPRSAAGYNARASLGRQNVPAGECMISPRLQMHKNMKKSVYKKMKLSGNQTMPGLMELDYKYKTCSDHVEGSDGSHHINTYVEKRVFKCDTCGYSFSRSTHLSRHARTHTGEKLYMCDTCGKSFSVLFTLSQHIRIHTGDRPYICDTCGKNFRCRSHLSDHIRIHTGDRPYSCDICGKCFSVRSHKTRHARTHTVD